MEDNIITIKAYKCEKKGGESKEIRRLSVQKTMFNKEYSMLADFNFTLKKMFPDFSNIDSSHLLYWKDEEGDFIGIKTSDDLRHAFECLSSNILKVYLIPIDKEAKEKCCNTESVLDNELNATQTHRTDTSKPTCAGQDSNEKELHKYVICDGCESNMLGYRFKCLECADYDLCESCFKENKHPSHMMVRIVKPDVKHHWRNLLGLMLNGRVKCNRATSGSCRHGKPGSHRESFWGQNCQNASASCNPQQQSGTKCNEENDYNQWNEYLKRLGQTVSHLLDQFGIDAMVDLEYPNGYTESVNKTTVPKEKSDSSEEVKKSDEVLSSASNEKCDTIHSNSSSEPQQPPESDFVKSEIEKSAVSNVETQTGAKPKNNVAASDDLYGSSQLKPETENSNESNVESQAGENSTNNVFASDDLDWSFVNENDVNTRVHIAQQQESTRNPNTSYTFIPEVQEGLIVLEEMGFKNENGNLTQLLEMTKGNISTVLDMLK